MALVIAISLAAQWLALSPHSKNVQGFDRAGRDLSVCSPRAQVGFLWVLSLVDPINVKTCKAPPGGGYQQ